MSKSTINTQLTEEDNQNWNPDLDEMDQNISAESEESTQDPDIPMVNPTNTESDSELNGSDSDTVDSKDEEVSKPDDSILDREIQCAACGHLSKQRDWFLSFIGSHYLICPTCGSVRYVCRANADYRK